MRKIRICQKPRLRYNYWQKANSTWNMITIPDTYRWLLKPNVKILQKKNQHINYPNTWWTIKTIKHTPIRSQVIIATSQFKSKWTCLSVDIVNMFTAIAGHFLICTLCMTGLKCTNWTREENCNVIVKIQPYDDLLSLCQNTLNL